MCGEESEVKLGTGLGSLGRPGIQTVRNRTRSKSRGEGEERRKERERKGGQKGVGTEEGEDQKS